MCSFLLQPRQGVTQAREARAQDPRHLTVSSLPSFSRRLGRGRGTGHGSGRTVQPRRSRPHSVSSGPNSCCSCRCSSCSKRSASYRMTSHSCCRSESSWSAAALPLNGNSGNWGHGWRRPNGRYARGPHSVTPGSYPRGSALPHPSGLGFSCASMLDLTGLIWCPQSIKLVLSIPP